MGLDMYLTKNTYVKNWDHHKPEKRHDITVLKGGKPHRHIQPARISYIVEDVAYWRKANAIHRWFVEHVQGGRDECQESYVEREQLQELVNACKQVLNTVETVPGKVGEGTTFYPDGTIEQHARDGDVVAQEKIARDLLPTQSGFFFGKTDYDEDYLRDLEETVAQIEPLLDEDGEFYYRASW